MKQWHGLPGWLVLTTAILVSVENTNAESKGDGAAGPAASMGEIAYVVRWQPAGQSMSDSAAIDISLTFTAEEARTTIDFPDRWALGLHDFHQRITDISVDGSLHAASLDGLRLELETRPGQRVTVGYRLSRRPEGPTRSLREALLPTATQDHVFFRGWVGLAIPDFFRCTSRSCRKCSTCGSFWG